MMKIGVIGWGVVGQATGRAFQGPAHLNVYDKFKKIGTLGQVAHNSDLIFVCVPTPTEDGLQDLRPLSDTLAGLAIEGCKVPIVVKCTVVPGTMDRFQNTYPELRLVHNPEFLTEKNAATDFLNQKCVVLSARNAGTLQLTADVFRLAFRQTPILTYPDFKTTELGKYIHNCFLATKVAFMNEMHNYAEKIGASYDSALQVAKSQQVIGDSHTQVPGPDGQFGFGGMCFPKDTQALLSSIPEGPAILTILQAAVRSNNLQRDKK